MIRLLFSIILFSVSYTSVLAQSRIADAVTVDTLAAFSPRARMSIVVAIVANRDLLHKADINTPERLYHFVSQLALTTSGFTALEENLNYSESGLLRVFPKRISPSQAKLLANKPEAIANYVYGDRLGNRGRETNDGWRYRGSGFISTTGRGNFLRMESIVNLPLEQRPELARQAVEALKIALSFWTFEGLNMIADTGSERAVRGAVSSGGTGVQETRLWTTRAERVFGAELADLGVSDPVGLEDLKKKEADAITDYLIRDGYLREDNLTGANGQEAVEEAIRSLLQEKRIVPSDSQIEGLPGSDAIFEDLLYGASNPRELLDE
ncbi:glycoside hydrolase family 19 protein [Rhizobium leguminosarum]|uniref:glycoside hydrolase family 19 protein n=1 Tax=Rhizobium leguminosarum TaxID=384 RepID=UPI003F96EB97